MAYPNLSTVPKPTDAHKRPPESIRTFYKACQKIDPKDLDFDSTILDLSRSLCPERERLKLIGHVPYENLRVACAEFGSLESDRLAMLGLDIPVYECIEIPGFLLIPALLPRQTQRDLSSRLLHDCLADNRHRTNLHAHYKIPYAATASNHEASFFNLHPESTSQFRPLVPNGRDPIPVSSILRKKLRWITLGGQYDWTEKVYNTEDSPPFPQDIADLMHSFLPDTKAEVAIVNIYSPGDTLSLHRDVSEESTKGLMSISLGCDCIFVIGLETANGSIRKNLAVRLRSGDAVYMSGCSRFAWHGVPQIIQGTCPPLLDDWPAQTALNGADNGTTADRYEAWRGWMSNKRINLNVRQLNGG